MQDPTTRLGKPDRSGSQLQIPHIFDATLFFEKLKKDRLVERGSSRSKSGFWSIFIPGQVAKIIVPELHSKNITTEKNWQTYVITDLQHIIVVNHRKALKQYTTGAIGQKIYRYSRFGSLSRLLKI